MEFLYYNLGNLHINYDIEFMNDSVSDILVVGGGGNGGYPGADGVTGTANSGGGGGGGSGACSGAGSGGSGIVIIRYKFQN